MLEFIDDLSQKVTSIYVYVGSVFCARRFCIQTWREFLWRVSANCTYSAKKLFCVVVIWVFLSCFEIFFFEKSFCRWRSFCIVHEKGTQSIQTRTVSAKRPRCCPATLSLPVPYMFLLSTEVSFLTLETTFYQYLKNTASVQRLRVCSTLIEMTYLNLSTSTKRSEILWFFTRKKPFN